MSRSRHTLLLATILASACIAGVPGRADPLLGTEVRPILWQASWSALAVPTRDGSGRDVGSTNWNFVHAFQSCCRTVVALPSGRLAQSTGQGIAYSDDDGKTWWIVRNETAVLVAYDSALAATPTGDIVAIEYQPAGEELFSYKYDAASGKWFTARSVLHLINPRLTVIPGRFRSANPGADLLDSSPYLVVIESADLYSPLYYSFDGLSYTEGDASYMLSGKIPDEMPAEEWSPPAPDPGADWMHAEPRSRIIPLADGRAIAAFQDLVPGACLWRTIASNAQWRCLSLELPDSGNIRVDSKGRMHRLSTLTGATFLYEVSSDGARTWRSTAFDAPAGSSIRALDFIPNGSLGLSAVGAVVQGPGGAGTFEHVVYKVKVAEDGSPSLDRAYTIAAGFGEISGTIKVHATVLPDGRIATSAGGWGGDVSVFAVESGS